MTSPDPDAEWNDLRGSLPSHQTEVMAAHQCEPNIVASADAEDRGFDDNAKYGPSGGI